MKAGPESVNASNEFIQAYNGSCNSSDHTTVHDLEIPGKIKR